MGEHVDSPAKYREEGDCAHCGQAISAGVHISEAGLHFCCTGCRAVYQVIQGAGLTQYYALREMDRPQELSPAQPSFGSFSEYDDPAFSALHTKQEGPDQSIDLYLEGVHCAACLWLVEKLPGLVKGVKAARLDFGRSIAHVVYDPQAVALSSIAKTLDGLGYTPHPFRAADRRTLAQKEERKFLMRLGIAGAAAGNTMLVAIALYAGATEEPVLGPFFRWVSLLVAIPTVIWAGRPFFAGAWAGIRAKTLHMDVPISLALLAATASSVWNTFSGTGHLYFDSVTSLIFLLLTARWLQMRALRAAKDASERLFSMAPSKARLISSEGESREVPVETLVPGQTVEVLAGESIPVDGVIAQGNSRIDNAILTGESKPQEVEPGTQVHAGANNVSARVLVTVTATGENTRVARLIAAVQEAQQRRAPIVMLADRLASYFVLVVLLLAGLSAALAWNQGPTVVMERLVAMLVITCPCALGLATPLALTHALGSAAQAGIYIKGADTIEALARIAHVILDKTGTLTVGRVSLTHFQGPKELAARFAALESHSSHPIAKAAVRAIPPKTSLDHAQSVIETAGGGIRGRVEGKELVVGTIRYLTEQGCKVSQEWKARAESMAASGSSPVYIAEDGQVEAIAAFGDPLRADAEQSVSALRRLGLRLSILSGDHPQVVKGVAERLGIRDAEGAVTPEGKLAHVEERRLSGQMVAMVGDGVNDAGALAAARVGIAVGGGADLSHAVADVFLTRTGLTPISEMVGGCRATMHVIYRNLAISLVYNVIGAALALGGYINPLVAAIAMPVSSLTVVLSSALSRPFRFSKPGSKGQTPKALGKEALAA